MKNSVIAILSVLVLLLGGYLLYDKVLVKEEKPNEEKTNVNEENKNTGTTTDEGKNEQIEEKSKYMLKPSTVLQKINGSKFEVVIDNTGKAYLLYNDKIKDSLASKFSQNEIGGYKAPGGSTMNSYKLLDNVITAYSVDEGNSGMSYFVFILKNGELAFLWESDIYFKEQINIKKIDNIKNVTTIIQGFSFGAYNAYAVDLNGNIISLGKYLK